MTSATQTVPKGYRQTEIGVIPADWDVKKLGDIADVTKLAGFEYSKYFNSYKDKGEIIVLRGTNITHNKLDLSDIRTIPLSTSKRLQRSQLNKNDLVFAYVGTIGPIYLVKEDNKYHLGPNTSKITVAKSNSPEFLLSYFTSRFVKNEIIEHTSIGAQPSLSMFKIRNFRIILPSTKQEQIAITTALSDADSLIEKLEALIEKKKNIKQGVMQELLTGKRRLPGFNGKWETKKLGELLDYEQPTEYLVKHADYSDDFSTPVLTAGKTFVLGYTAEENSIFQNLPTIIFDDFTTAIKYVDFPFKAKSSAMKMLIPRSKEVNLKFVFAKMQMIDFQLGDHKRYWISEYQNIRIATPKPDEQTAIAIVLSDMDTEIEKLEAELEKYQNIKQGMMQTLLIGKIRLINI